MPAINNLNPICEICDEFAKKNGFTSLGEQKYTCRRHYPNWNSKCSGVSGGQILGLQKLTPYERLKKHRAKKIMETL